MKRLWCAALVLASLSLPARAQDAPSPEALSAARELSAIMTSDTIGQITSAMTAQVWPSIESQFGSKLDAPARAELRGEFEKTVAAFTAEVMKGAPAVYARNFTVQELRDMLAFYRSPTGVKAIRTMPKVLTDISALIGPQAQVFQRDLNTRIMAVLEKHGVKN